MSSSISLPVRVRTLWWGEDWSAFVAVLVLCERVLEEGMYLLDLHVGRGGVVVMFVKERVRDGYGLVVGLCCDCCSGGGRCLIADWTLRSGR
jgi:hypothetical protein